VFRLYELDKLSSKDGQNKALLPIFGEPAYFRVT